MKLERKYIDRQIRHAVNRSIHALKPIEGEIVKEDPWEVIEWARNKLKALAEEKGSTRQEQANIYSIIMSGALVQARILSDARFQKTVQQAGKLYDALSKAELHQEALRLAAKVESEDHASAPEGGTGNDDKPAGET